VYHDGIEGGERLLLLPHHHKRQESRDEDDPSSSALSTSSSSSTPLTENGVSPSTTTTTTTDPSSSSISSSGGRIEEDLSRVVVWSGGMLEGRYKCRGWWRPQEQWVKRIDGVSSKSRGNRPAHLNKAMADPKYR